MRPKYSHYYFDIDGTITDSSRSLATFCNDLNLRFNFGLPIVDIYDKVAVKRLMKTPTEALFENYGFPPEKFPMLMKIYGTEYSADEKYHSEIFPGIKDLLSDLRNSGDIRLNYLTHNFLTNVKRDLGEVFDLFCFGYSLNDLKRINGGKTEAIIHDLTKEKVRNKKNAVMVGDTTPDFLAAKISGCDFVAVNYGFGSWENRRELKVANNISELRGFLIG